VYAPARLGSPWSPNIPDRNDRVEAGTVVVIDDGLGIVHANTTLCFALAQPRAGLPAGSPAIRCGEGSA
jgi:hypothetical protein